MCVKIPSTWIWVSSSKFKYGCTSWCFSSSQEKSKPKSMYHSFDFDWNGNNPYSIRFLYIYRRKIDHPICRYIIHCFNGIYSLLVMTLKAYNSNNRKKNLSLLAEFVTTFNLMLSNHGTFFMQQQPNFASQGKNLGSSQRQQP